MDEKNTSRWMPCLKHFFAVLIVGALYLLLQPLFSPLLDKAYTYLLGLGLLGQIAFGGLVVLVTLYLLLEAWRRPKIYVSKLNLFWLGLIGALYAYYRCWDMSNHFWTIIGTEGLAWVDLFVLPWLLAVGWRGRQFSRKARAVLEKKDQPIPEDIEDEDAPSDPLLVLDNPVAGIEEDQLGFGELAKKLRNQLVRLNLKGYSTSLGIIAPWGYGKTTFLKILSRELEETGDCIIIRFYPRDSRSAKHIQADFFAVLTKELSKYYFGIGFLLSRYAKSLDLLDGYASMRLIPKALALLFPAEDKEAINEALKAIGKRLYIFIDDMDRLDAEEILETFKLIDRSASFSNTVFVTAYDKGYINQVLTSYLDKDSLGQCYADKYMTWEYSITEHAETGLRGIMATLLRERITDGLFVTQESVLNGWRRVAPTIVPLLGSVRHLKRYYNSFIARYVERQDEVDPGDFFLLSLLRYLDMETYLKLVMEMPCKDNAEEGRETPDDPGVDIIARLIPDKMRESKEATVQILRQLFPKDYSQFLLDLGSKGLAYLENFGLARDWRDWDKYKYNYGYNSLIYVYYFVENLEEFFLAKHMHKLLTSDDPERELNTGLPDIDIYRFTIVPQMDRWIRYLVEGGVRNKQDLTQLTRLCMASGNWEELLCNLAEESHGKKIQKILDMSEEEYRKTLKTAFSALIPEYAYGVRTVVKHFFYDESSPESNVKRSILSEEELKSLLSSESR